MWVLGIRSNFLQNTTKIHIIKKHIAVYLDHKYVSMRKLLITLLIIAGVAAVTTLFFIGNPRNPFVKKTTRTYIALQKSQQEHQKGKAEQKIIDAKEKLIQEEQARINAMHYAAMKSYNSWTIALKQWVFSSAVEYFDDALAQNSWYTNTRINKAIALNQLGQTTGALEAYEQATILDPKNFQARKNQAVLYFNAWEYKNAIRNFNKAIEQNSWDVGVWINKWIAHYYIKQYAQAADAYDKALSIDPLNENAAYNAGMLAKEQKKYAQSVGYFNIVVKVNPEKKDLRLARGSAAYASGQLMTAYESFIEAYKRNPDQEELLKSLWKVSFDMWEYERAGKYFDTYLRIYWDKAEIWAYRWNAYYKQENYQKAYLSYKKSLKLKSNAVVKENYYKALAKFKN